MPRTRSHSRVRTTLYATLVLAACVALPWLLPATGCQLDTRPLWGGRTALDEDDGGSE
jgi:hypothetical protein